MDYQAISDHFREMFQGALELTGSMKLASVSEINEKQTIIRLDASKVSKAVGYRIADYFSELPPEIKNKEVMPLVPSYLFGNPAKKIPNIDQVFGNTNTLSILQKSYIKSFANDITRVESYDQGFELVDSFKNKLYQSTELSEEEKLLLLEIAVGSEVLLDFITTGRLDYLNRNIMNELGNEPASGRVTGCTVEWRKVWLGGVVGLTTGAITGAIAGATVGTVALPVLGTATGAVSAAVFLGFSGFVTGVASGVVTDLLGSCFRSTTLVQSYESCGQAWEAFNQGIITEVPPNCFSVSLSIKQL